MQPVIAAITSFLNIPAVQRYMSQRLLVAMLTVAAINFLPMSDTQQVMTVIIGISLLVCLTIRPNVAEAKEEPCTPVN